MGTYHIKSINNQQWPMTRVRGVKEGPAARLVLFGVIAEIWHRGIVRGMY